MSLCSTCDMRWIWLGLCAALGGRSKAVEGSISRQSPSSTAAALGGCTRIEHGRRHIIWRLVNCGRPQRVLMVSRMWVHAIAILLFASEVVSASLDARDVVGSCRYEKTSAAVLTCLQPGGKWSPPSTSCCKALLYAIDQLPGSGENGACCLCRYMRAKHTSPGLVMSYIMCQGKDRHIVNRWTFPITSCYGVNGVCPGSKKTSSTQKDRPVVHEHGVSNIIFMIMWAVAAVALCVVLLVCCWYLWWVNPAANSPKSSQSAPGSFLDGTDNRRLSSGRRDSAQLKLRRTSSSRSSPNS